MEAGGGLREGVYRGARKELVASSQICIIFQRTIPAL